MNSETDPEIVDSLPVIDERIVERPHETETDLRNICSNQLERARFQSAVRCHGKERERRRYEQ